jgi:hypothetical protein
MRGGGGWGGSSLFCHETGFCLGQENDPYHQAAERGLLSVADGERVVDEDHTGAKTPLYSCFIEKRWMTDYIGKAPMHREKENV